MSLLIGQHIKTILSGDPTVTASLSDRVYPVAVTESTPIYPLLVYANNGTRPDETKDGASNDTVSVTLVLLIDDYKKGITLMNHIRYLFEGCTADYPLFEVLDCSLINSAEDYDLELAKYVFTISLTFNTIDK